MNWRRALLLGLWGFVVATITVILVFELLPRPQQVAPLTEMAFSQVADSPQGTSVALPDNWRSFPDRPLLTGVYRAKFAYPSKDSRWAVFIPGYSGRIAVTINNVELSSGGFISGELIADQSVPYFALIPQSILKQADNELVITLTPGGKLNGFLSQTYVGPARLMRASYNWHYFRAERLPVLVAFWQLLLAALLILLWYSRRSERAALTCAALLLLSCVHSIPIFLPDSIHLADTAASLGYITNFWLSVTGLLFVYYLTERELPFKAWYFLVLPALATIAFLALPRALFNYFDVAVVVPFSLLMSVWVVYALVHSAIWERRWDCAIILLSIIGACTIAVHDTLVITNVLPDKNFLHFRVVYILILPALSVVFLERLIQSMNRVDNLVSTLEERIEEKETQLRETFQQRQVLEGRQALNEERQRIMRDMHDGLGGQLMSIIAMSTNPNAEPDAIESSARAALEDLRTLIHSLDVQNDITGILGTFRERAEQQLALQSIDLEWQMVEIPPIDGLTPTVALNVLRVLQEATTNAAKHSGADQVTIRFSVVDHQPQKLRIDVIDNGCGFEQAAISSSARGRGLQNMASRASDLKGTLEVTPSPAGTTVSLSIPTSYKATE